MKNKIKKLIFLILINLFITSNLISDEINFEANSDRVIDKDNRIIAKNVKIFNQKKLFMQTRWIMIIKSNY